MGRGGDRPVKREALLWRQGVRRINGDDRRNRRTAAMNSPLSGGEGSADRVVGDKRLVSRLKRPRKGEAGGSRLKEDKRRQNSSQATLRKKGKYLGAVIQEGG